VTKGLTSVAIREKSVVVVGDARSDPRYLTAFGSTLSEIIIPILDPRGTRVVGTVDVESERANAFSDADQNMLEECAKAAFALWIATWTECLIGESHTNHAKTINGENPSGSRTHRLRNSCRLRQTTKDGPQIFRSTVKRTRIAEWCASRSSIWDRWSPAIGSGQYAHSARCNHHKHIRKSALSRSIQFERKL
jgi:hypothetical protein